MRLRIESGGGHATPERRPSSFRVDRRRVRLEAGEARRQPEQLGRRPARRRAATGPPCRRRPWTASGPTRARISGWWRNARRRLAAQQPREPELDGRRVEQVAAPDDEVDAVPHVVHDHAERVGPVAGPVAHQEVAVAGGLVGDRPRQQVHPALRARPQRHPQARVPVLGERPRPAPARDTRSRATAARAPPRTRRTSTVRSRRRRRARARAARPAPPRRPRRRPTAGRASARHGTRRTAAARRAASPSRSRSSSSAASYSGRERWRSWSSIRSTTVPAGGPRRRPTCRARSTRCPRWRTPGRRRREARDRSRRQHPRVGPGDPVTAGTNSAAVGSAVPASPSAVGVARHASDRGSRGSRVAATIRR